MTLFDVGIEIVAHVCGGLSYSMECFEQRRFVVERLSGVGDEDSGYTQCVVNNEDGRCGVPCRIATRLKGVAYAPAGERRGVGFLL